MSSQLQNTPRCSCAVYTTVDSPALHHCNTCIAQYLVSAGAVVNQRGKDGQTPLHWSAIRGFVRSAASLLDAGAIIDLRDEFGFTPFLRAVQSGHMGLANFLLASGAAIEHCDNEGHNAMHWAAYYGFINMCELLHRKAPQLIHSVDNGSMTPYMIACRSGFIATITMLAGMGSATDQQDKDSRTGPDHLTSHHPHLSGFATFQRNIAKCPSIIGWWLPKNVCNPVTHNCLKIVLGLGYVHWILYIIPLTMYLLWSHILLAIATPFLWSAPPLPPTSFFVFSAVIARAPCVPLTPRPLQVRSPQGRLHLSRVLRRHSEPEQVRGGVQRPCSRHADVRHRVSHLCNSEGRDGCWRAPLVF
jgi:ankyrin repeat protein/membrane protein implicated in regulation of membrane protease activity